MNYYKRITRWEIIKEAKIKSARRPKRLEIANQFIKIISNYGRHFFKHKEDISYFKFDSNNRIRFVDSYTRVEVFIAYKGDWKGFTHGGTLRDLVIALKEYIYGDKPLPLKHLGPWPDYICDGDLWGYGEDMIIVREECSKLEVPDA
jgi:hypothetical protein